ncbi:MAG: hemin uptake protein HemP [Gammaproteobacteria bacterium]|nr:hemin uptake protein HemP [Gammaproteobacteria bacterium]MDX5503011.1 hemin uptake protein HemP [Halomonas sp.]
MTERREFRPPWQDGGDSAARQVVSSRCLLPEGQPLHIEHEGEVYTLRRTRTGKLILTK